MQGSILHEIGLALLPLPVVGHHCYKPKCAGNCHLRTELDEHLGMQVIRLRMTRCYHEVTYPPVRTPGKENGDQ